MLDLEKCCTDHARIALNEARLFKEKQHIHYVGTEIVLAGILSVNCVARSILNNYGINYTRYLNALLPNLTSQYINNDRNDFTPKAKTLLQKSADIAESSNCSFVATEHMLLAMLNFEECFANDFLRELASNYSLLKNDVECAVERLASPDKKTKNPSVTMSSQPQNERKIVLGSPIKMAVNTIKNVVAGVERLNSDDNPLAPFGIDLTERARLGKLDPVIGRTNEISRMIQTLSRRSKNSPLLIGEPGIGKSAVVEGLAQKIARGDVPLDLQNKIVFSLDITGLVAGAKYRGEFEERFKKAIDYARESDHIILFIDEIHTITAAGSDGMGATEMLKPILARGELQLIGATTIAEYRKYIEKDPALDRRFQTIMVEPPNEEECISIIKGLKDNFEAHHQVEITDEAIESAVRLSERYISDRFLPDKAIDLIDEAAAHARLVLCAPDGEIMKLEEEVKQLVREREYCVQMGSSVLQLDEKIAEINEKLDELYAIDLKRRSRENPYIDGEDVAKIISEMTSIPIARLTESQSERLLRLESELHKRVIGQEEAVCAISRAVRRASACVKDLDKPIGSFIFVGPTGVGKTELSKALAETVFGDEKMLIRIDMSEYMEKSSVAKLIGAPPGYVGYDEEGQLTEKVRRKPFSVVLFDEIEKAHPDIFNIMLQILDDGRLTDSKGRVVDFKNTIIIMTSNTGAKIVLKSESATDDNIRQVYDVKDGVMDALKKQFRPEFLNRVDDIIVFNKLSHDECGQIADILCNKLIQRLKLQNVNLTISENARELILDKGYDEEYGARPLKRTVQRLVEDALSEDIIAGKVRSGDNITAIKDGEIIRFIK